MNMPLYLLIPLGVLLAIVAIYVAVRVGSIAHFRTKAEFDRDNNSKRRM